MQADGKALRPPVVQSEQAAAAGMREVGIGALLTAVQLAGTAVSTWTLLPGMVIIGIGLGLVAPTLINVVLAEVDPAQATSCADWEALQRMADLEGGPLLTTPTLGEVLGGAGRQMACVGSGSPGTTYLTNPAGTGPVVNWATAWPSDVAKWLANRLGGFFTEETSSWERTDFVLRALCEHLIPRWRPDVVIVWITEPDHAQHAHGLGAPESLGALREVDRRLEELLVAMHKADGAEPDVIVTSDHGFSTITERIPLEEELDSLRDIPGLEALEEGDAVFAGSGLYLHGAALERLPEIPEGFGFLVPRGEGIRTLGVLFPSRLFEGRTPPGGDLLAGFVGGVLDPHALDLDVLLGA